MKPHPNNAPTTAAASSIPSMRILLERAVLATMLLLMLYCAGCLTSKPQITPSVHQGPTGNAISAQLPIGTRLELPADSPVSSAITAVFANELEKGMTKSSLYLVTPAYISERDARELQLLKRLEELRSR